MAALCESLQITEVITVPEQKDPDPDFPTVKFPNPEEEGALDLSFRTADASNRTLIIANDPDADRLAVAEKVKYV
jgi:phosphoglucomutase